MRFVPLGRSFCERFHLSRHQITFPFPQGQIPTAIGFSHMPGGFVAPGGATIQVTVWHSTLMATPSRTPAPMADLSLGATAPRPGLWAVWGTRRESSRWPDGGGREIRTGGVEQFPGEQCLSPCSPDGTVHIRRTRCRPRPIADRTKSVGYQKVIDIMAADQVVADAGTDYAAGLDVYTLGLFGEPSATAPWMLQFGGHHLGLNVTFVGDKAVCSPLHTGILPARFEKNGKIVRGLGRENDKAFDLLTTFFFGPAESCDHRP
jgi:hypothetical protein